MASIRKLAKGWRAEIARKGVRASKVFPTQREAKDWAARQEYLILNREAVAAATLFGDVLERYAREVSVTKRSEVWEVRQIDRLKRSDLARKMVADLTAENFASWRDGRLRTVQAATVNREMNLLSAVMTQARREWGMIKTSPMSDVRRPTAPHKRERRPSKDELDRLAFVAGEDLTRAQARAHAAFLFAIETGMRAGEICGLRGADLDLERRVARLHLTKNGAGRDVPLSKEAVRLLEALPKAEPVFGMTSARLDANWRKLRGLAAIEGLNFHDSRHEAITRLSRKLDPLALAKMVGHRDIKMLMIYYDETAEELARRLD
ncbi:tyrosine-type recombinase/integrase [Pseudooceanicola algae]|uniref:Tyrosine recombinase XerC n=1 Tax=Pseudooceanicola algae TaxID=1537215 RepID=A0A418SJ34_9RHOB|nr:site-specific integrase [Pseudooceanicola algae]QPM90126.1 Tyrosine recombinase XerC [Pseudooceanicola algae]